MSEEASPRNPWKWATGAAVILLAAAVVLSVVLYNRLQFAQRTSDELGEDVIMLLVEKGEAESAAATAQVRADDYGTEVARLSAVETGAKQARAAQLVVLAKSLREEAFGPRIAAELEEHARRRVSRGALYGTLERLEGKGFLVWELQAGTAGRAGQPMRRFQVTEEGLEALRSSRQAVRNLEAGIEDLLSESR